MGAFKANRQGNPFLAARRSLLCQSLRARQRSLEIAKDNANGLGAHWPSWAATGIDGRIYAVAYDPEVYDPVSGVWWFLPPLPTSRAYLAGATDRDGQVADEGHESPHRPGDQPGGQAIARAHRRDSKRRANPPRCG